MVQIQFNSTEKAEKMLAGYRYINGLQSKEKALNQILETLSLKEELEEYLNKIGDDKHA